jgi:hypothetical protein
MTDYRPANTNPESNEIAPLDAFNSNIAIIAPGDGSSGLSVWGGSISVIDA